MQWAGRAGLSVRRRRGEPGRRCDPSSSHGFAMGPAFSPKGEKVWCSALHPFPSS